MNNTPYTVPDGFFEHSRIQALDNAGKVKKRRFALLGSVCTITAFLSLTLIFHQFSNSVNTAQNDYDTQYVDEEILSIYEYDIFLNNLNL